MRFALSGVGPAAKRRWRHATAAVYAGYSVVMFVVAGLVSWIPVAVLPRLSWRWAVAHWVCRTLSRVTCTPLTVQGLDNLPTGRPYVMVANHASVVDSHTLIAALPGELSFVAKAELTKSFAIRHWLSRLQTQFVERYDKQKGVEDARRIGRSAKNGRLPLIFFPEGGTTRVPGLRTFHMGAFVVAAEAGLPVVPIAVRGTRSIFRSGAWFPRRGAAAVVIGEPIDPTELTDTATTDAWTTATRLREASREFILRYCGEPDLTAEKTPL